MLEFLKAELQRRGDHEWWMCGAVLCAETAIDDILAEIEPAMIADDRCRHFVETAARLRREDRPTTVDVIPLHLDLEIVSIEDLDKMLSSVPRTRNASLYASVVRECWQIREMAAATVRMLDSLNSPSADVSESCNVMASELTRLATRSDTADEIVEFRDVLPQLLAQETSANRTITTGIVSLDRIITGGGWSPGQLIVVGARPAVGKTSLLTGFALAAIRNDFATLLFSYEMTPREIGGRIERQGSISRTDSVSREMAAEFPLTICNSGGWTLEKVEAEIRRHVASAGIKLVIIDYISLIPMKRGEKTERYLHIGNITQTLKQLAMRLGITIIAAQQFNRAIESRANKHPLMSDFRESGSVEQDADILLGIDRDVPEDGQSSAGPSAGAIYVLKQRNGPRATIAVEFNPEMCLFRDVYESYGGAFG